MCVCVCVCVCALTRQFIVNLDGDVEIEVSSGEKRVLHRGDVFFVEDLTGVNTHHCTYTTLRVTW